MSTEKLKILIVGGHGFVGKNVVQLLKESDYEVFPMSRRDGLDLRDYSSIQTFLQKIKPDVIINCAAHVGSLHYITEYAADVVNDNMRIILNLYQAVKDVCPKTKIINPISNCSYPGKAKEQKESEFWDGAVHRSVWSYGNTRRMIIVIGQCYESQYAIKTINFLSPNSYGPKDYVDPNKTHALNGIIIRMLEAKKNNLPNFEIWGTGKPLREWIYVKDLARMLVSSIEKKECQVDPVNIAQNKAYSILEIARKVKKAIFYDGKLVFNTKYQDGDPIKKMDNQLFRHMYPDFSFTDLSQGIVETVNYYKKTLDIK